MIWVADPAIKIAQLIVNHVLKIGVIEVVGQSSPETKGKLFVEEVQERIDERCWNSDHTQANDLLYMRFTLWTKRGKFLSTIAFTIPPFTEAM